MIIIRKEFSVDKDENFALFDLNEEFKQNWSVLDIYFIYFVQYCKKYGICSKTYQSYSPGDQQLTELLIH